VTSEKDSENGHSRNKKKPVVRTKVLTELQCNEALSDDREEQMMQLADGNDLYIEGFNGFKRIGT
jgi:hypothetical protein